MRFLFIPILLLASGAFAQEVAPAMNFPDNAITQVQAPAIPEAGTAADVPKIPANPTSPTSPVLDVWPANTMPVFVLACSQGNMQLFPPCRCIIDALMKDMTHKEFMELSAKNAVVKDIRYATARQQCAMKSQQKKK
jgi:hypothetical protein